MSTESHVEQAEGQKDVGCFKACQSKEGAVDRTSLQSLAAAVQNDPKCKELTEKLLKYAQDELSKNINDIVSNLNKLAPAAAAPAAETGTPRSRGCFSLCMPEPPKQKPPPALEVDILWPGAGYNSVCCGGNFEVMSLLEKQGLVKVHDVCGASGGACSTILALADSANSSRTLIFYYMVYAKWAEISWDMQVWQATSLWPDIYRKCVEDDGAFARVSKRGYAACAAGKTFKNVVMHNFKSKDQVVVAFQASGEASVTGAARGLQIDSATDKVGNFSDGGNVCPFPGRTRKVLYYHTFYGYALKCNLETIEILYKKGVDETIRLLKSENLHIATNNTYLQGMELAMNGEGGMFITKGEECAKVKQKTMIRPSGEFLDLTTGKQVPWPPKDPADQV
mmetsp:Transcript_83119/g.144413  ORF Transcript_83119/g.144413 Transcript_83119/m.144413 type:complete len:395 (-) Transcript_83119:97-1281(-)